MESSNLVKQLNVGKSVDKAETIKKQKGGNSMKSNSPGIIGKPSGNSNKCENKKYAAGGSACRGTSKPLKDRKTVENQTAGLADGQQKPTKSNKSPNAHKKSTTENEPLKRRSWPQQKSISLSRKATPATKSKFSAVNSTNGSGTTNDTIAAAALIRSTAGAAIKKRTQFPQTQEKDMAKITGPESRNRTTPIAKRGKSHVRSDIGGKVKRHAFIQKKALAAKTQTPFGKDGREELKLSQDVSTSRTPMKSKYTVLKKLPKEPKPLRNETMLQRPTKSWSCKMQPSKQHLKPKRTVSSSKVETKLRVKERRRIQKKSLANKQKYLKGIESHGDWSSYISSTGRPYFFNWKTEKSQWTVPKGWPQATVAVPSEEICFKKVLNVVPVPSKASRRGSGIFNTSTSKSGSALALSTFVRKRSPQQLKIGKVASTVVNYTVFDNNNAVRKAFKEACQCKPIKSSLKSAPAKLDIGGQQHFEVGQVHNDGKRRKVAWNPPDIGQGTPLISKDDTTIDPKDVNEDAEISGMSRRSDTRLLPAARQLAPKPVFTPEMIKRAQESLLKRKILDRTHNETETSGEVYFNAKKRLALVNASNSNVKGMRVTQSPRLNSQGLGGTMRLSGGEIVPEQKKEKKAVEEKVNPVPVRWCITGRHSQSEIIVEDQVIFCAEKHGPFGEFALKGINKMIAKNREILSSRPFALELGIEIGGEIQQFEDQRNMILRLANDKLTLPSPVNVTSIKKRRKCAEEKEKEIEDLNKKKTGMVSIEVGVKPEQTTPQVPVQKVLPRSVHNNPKTNEVRAPSGNHAGSNPSSSSASAASHVTKVSKGEKASQNFNGPKKKAKDHSLPKRRSRRLDL